MKKLLLILGVAFLGNVFCVNAQTSACNCMVPLDGSFTVAEFTNGVPPDYRTDDGATALKILPFTFCLYGTNYSGFYINSNGNISFGAPYYSYTSASFPSNSFIMAAPFMADVDTRNVGSGLVYYKILTHYAIVKWEHVGYFNQQVDKLNTFQVIISDGTDPIIPNGGNVSFCYGDMQWTTGAASGGTNGFGGSPANAGVNGGDGVNGFQIGRFDQAGTVYNGVTTPSGISWLENKSFDINVCPISNMAPIATGINNSDTIRVCSINDSIVLNATFLSPEINQNTTVTINMNGTPNASILSNIGGNCATSQVLIHATSANLGNNIITFTATDNGIPAQTTTVNANVFVGTSLGATFSYTGTPFCVGGANPLPTFSGGGLAGTFSATPAGLLIDAFTGMVDLSVSIPGTYTVTNTVAALGSCPAVTATATITIAFVATFSYTGTPYCQNTGTVVPTYNGGGMAGTYTSSAGLYLDAITGNVNLGLSNPGNYTVTNTIVASGCPQVTATSSISITVAPEATFSYLGSPYCTGSPNPSPTYSGNGVAGIFSATPSGLSINSTTGLVNLVLSIPGTYVVSNNIAASGGCSAVSATSTITINTAALATFSYSGNPYCQNGSNPVPFYSGGGNAGIFSASTGLSIDAGTGIITLATSTPGTYIVTNTIAASGGCAAAIDTGLVIIESVPVTNFNFTGTPYCQGGANPLPTFNSGGTAGSFSSTTGLVINATTGLINLASSTPGNYTVANQIYSAGCGTITSTATITIVGSYVASFNYVASPYCQNAPNPLPTFIGGGVAGIFTAPVGLTINASTGLVTLSSSTPGTYMVTNTVVAVGCPSSVDSSSITIEPAPIATFNYIGNPYCQAGANPLPTFSSGGVAGNFTSSNGLIIDGITGLVDLQASIPGTYTVTNTVQGSAGCATDVSTSTITISVAPVSAFSYISSPYCQNSPNPNPTYSGGGIAGTFTFIPAGLSINSFTGTVNLMGSLPGTYTITNVVTASGCAPSSSSTSITITATPVATFSYTGNPYCSNAANPLPMLGVDASTGTCTANGGLPVNSVTGEVDLTTALPGTYTVTNSIAAFGGCPQIFASTQIVINAVQDPSFTYAGSPYCTVGTVNPTNIVTGGGTFSSTTGLTISASGTINLATSTPGTYIITYVTPGPCVATGTQQIVVNASPNVTVTSDTICLGQTATLTASGAT